jgi:hypothetical protein
LEKLDCRVLPVPKGIPVYRGIRVQEVRGIQVFRARLVRLEVLLEKLELLVRRE